MSYVRNWPGSRLSIEGFEVIDRELAEMPSMYLIMESFRCECQLLISMDLYRQGFLIRRGQLEHRRIFCWRRNGFLVDINSAFFGG